MSKREYLKSEYEKYLEYGRILGGADFKGCMYAKWLERYEADYAWFVATA